MPTVQYSGVHLEVEHPFDTTQTVARGGRIDVTGAQADSLGAKPSGKADDADWTLVQHHKTDDKPPVKADKE